MITLNLFKPFEGNANGIHQKIYGGNGYLNKRLFNFIFLSEEKKFSVSESSFNDDEKKLIEEAFMYESLQDSIFSKWS